MGTSLPRALAFPVPVENVSYGAKTLSSPARGESPLTALLGHSAFATGMALPAPNLPFGACRGSARSGERAPTGLPRLLYMYMQMAPARLGTMGVFLVLEFHWNRNQAPVTHPALGNDVPGEVPHIAHRALHRISQRWRRPVVRSA